LRGTGTAPARIPHRGEVQVSTAHINWQLSSNGLEATGDFVNRAVITRISKRPVEYKEGDVLAHVKANQSKYLGAVFRIIKEWFDSGCERSDENRHDFTEWSQPLDWIVQGIFGLAPVLDGHVEELLRVSDPTLSWLRRVAIDIEREGRLDKNYRPATSLMLSDARIVFSEQGYSPEFRAAPDVCWATIVRDLGESIQWSSCNRPLPG